MILYISLSVIQEPYITKYNIGDYNLEDCMLLGILNISTSHLMSYFSISF